MNTKLPFPNYLNSPRLFFYWEADEVQFVFLVNAIIFAGLFLLNANPLVLTLTMLLTVPLSYRGYKRLKKDVAPNWLNHYLYYRGMSNGISNREIKILESNGKTNLIPPSFVTVFEEN
ncbi:type IV conjugative transfer system protein TraL [Aquamicrobium sp.]|jgi:hypothetical protein|uniref:type IV conjugative transfer system protein TraL n=1 Tax=Aquamicrobium sp. TaxID=1872579 RepID=UPI002589FEA9|nr:type IV conjugative transfer system protein TraL [Aquamicrobium sp.]MCK9550944.1 type IV conjugative transfer system protein TraL [Aquamicrobium sp.]